MANFSYIIKYILLLRLIKEYISDFCYEKNFPVDYEDIKINSPQKMKVGPEKEYCFKYKLTSNKNYISLTFLTGNTYTGEVYVYNSLDKIRINYSKNYIDSESHFFINKNNFKEINVKNYDEYVFIIVRDSKHYYFVDYLLLYDSEVPIIMKPGIPLTFKNFMSNEKYFFNFSSQKKVKVVITTNQKGLVANIIINDYGRYINQNFQLDKHLIFEYKDIILTTTYNISIEKVHDYQNQHFSIVLYENLEEYKEIKENDNIEVKYLIAEYKDIKKQAFYFYADVSNYKNSNSINFKLDFLNKKQNYIDIRAKLINQNDEISDLVLNNIKYEEKLLEGEYDVFSDEYKKFYFNTKNIDGAHKYIAIKVEISGMEDKYYGVKSFNISLGKDMKVYDFRANDNYNASSFKLDMISYIPTYVKLLFDISSKYLFNIPYEDYIQLIKGDILEVDGINHNYLDNPTNLHIIEGISEVTIRLFGYKHNINMNIQKYKPNEVIIISQKDRNEDVYSREFSESECQNGKIKYLIYNYDINKYEHGGNKISKYWTTTDNAEFKLYHKNNTKIVDNSILPSNKFIIEKETQFESNSNVDLFGITCSKQGTLFIRPLRKSFKHKTHDIKENSLNLINLSTQNEILQIMFPIKNAPNHIYFSLLSLDGKKISIKPNTKGLFSETSIENKIFTLEIDTKKYKMDQMAIEISSDGYRSIEVIETSDCNICKYQIIQKNETKVDIKKNNFVKFLNDYETEINITFNNLEKLDVAYGIVSLATNDSKYLPSAFNFKNGINQEISKENMHINIKVNKTNDSLKPYKAFVFSVKKNEMVKKYNIEIEKDKGSEESKKEEERKKKENEENKGKEGEKKKDSNGKEKAFLSDSKDVILLSSTSLSLISAIIFLIYLCIANKKKSNLNIQDIEGGLLSMQ